MKCIATSFLASLVGLVAMTLTVSAADQNVVVVLDDSGSMSDRMRSGQAQTKMDVAKEALQTVLKDIPDDAEVGVLTLNSRADGSNWIIPLGPVDRQSIQLQINRIRADGGTPLGAAMKVATDALLAARQKNRYGTYRLLIVTDGEASDQNLVKQYLPDIKSRGVTTDVIGVAMSSQHSLATQVGNYRPADDPESLVKAIAQVFAETTDEDSGSGESDYDLLGGIPDEVASAAVASLTLMNNEPIGESPQPESVSPNIAAQASTTPNTPTPTPQRPASNRTSDSDSGGSGMGVACIGVLLLIGVVIVVLGVVSKSGRKRTR